MDALLISHLNALTEAVKHLNSQVMVKIAAVQLYNALCTNHIFVVMDFVLVIQNSVMFKQLAQQTLHTDVQIKAVPAQVNNVQQITCAHKHHQFYVLMVTVLIQVNNVIVHNQTAHKQLQFNVQVAFVLTLLINVSMDKSTHTFQAQDYYNQHLFFQIVLTLVNSNVQQMHHTNVMMVHARMTHHYVQYSQDVLILPFHTNAHQVYALLIVIHAQQAYQNVYQDKHNVKMVFAELNAWHSMVAH